MALSRGVFAGGPRQAMNTFVRSMSSSHKAPVTVAVTGAAGQIGYATLMRIANGELLGKDQPINLKLIEVQQGLKPLKGVMMEVQDGAFPLLKSMTGTADLHEGFGDADYAILIGAKPRGPGMERGDLMSANASIFKEQGKALNKAAKKNVKALVVGNPANTNALVLSANAPNIDPMNIHAMTRLDQNRALAQLALKLKTGVSNIEKVCIWGNHSSTQYPDVTHGHATIKGKKTKLTDVIDPKWYTQEFLPTVQKRGAAIINARGASSAASAGNSAIDHIRDLMLGAGSAWCSIAFPSNGEYKVEKGLWFSMPTICSGNGKFEVVKNLNVDDFSSKMMKATEKELKEERDSIRHLLK
mmetsp:Transcript_3892/g.11637  ORF Transcript_3892/g.11637 Transcript_3892/m.11637 type:complete len:357 (+) Transcript_3892:115-1185(+)|eukprot:CAMPEP_0198725458 /NCGR_PEP_ID=MMETSP1475-20131203/2762_1 /TAXON_ID= ORGANISM="Unidentified sp., Strain CCMP1999" /NCGR_SAMPLE_ID=MMETSP1475 /ASSEMBLY_ACC=CAM_ASM_001111 /LENGTH=356 /DNA_ID=CAMNT_0044487243 /DNA_START=77 /DNA_END=1147 /DNA_ORIENTATION=-